MTEWTIRDPDSGNERTVGSRSEAEAAIENLQGIGIDAEILPPDETDGGQPTEVVDVEPASDTEDAAADLPERSVADDPLTWIPGEFVDTIDGTQAINRKGFEVLAHFYNVDCYADLEVPPEDTEHTYCRVKARAVTSDGRECEAYGSAHVERGDDPELLLEMADTRARKRALSIATGVGAVAVEELKNRVDR